MTSFFFIQNTGSKEQHTKAAAFFARKNASSSHNLANGSTALHKSSVAGEVAKAEQVNHVSNFAGILGKCPPPAPSSLLKKLQEETTTASTTVRIFHLFIGCDSEPIFVCVLIGFT